MTEPLGDFVIADEPGVYYAWPSVARLGSGELLVVVYQGGAHTHSHGKVVLYRSAVDGKTWDKGRVVADTMLDDRDPGILALRDGTVIVTSRVAWWKGVDEEKIDPVRARQLVDQYARGYLIKSTDGGRTWSSMIPYPFQPKGPIELSDGTLFAVDWSSEAVFTAYISDDQGETWEPRGRLGALPPTLDVDGAEYAIEYSEPHFVQLPGGRIVTYIRAHSTGPSRSLVGTAHLWVAYSDDSGKTWSEPVQTSVAGYPPHALLLEDGRVLLTYGYRWRPFGQRARVSDDGVSFERYPEIVVRGDAPDGDLGYPSSVQLDSNRILTVYYQKRRLGEKPVLMGTIWRLE